VSLSFMLKSDAAFVDLVRRVSLQRVVYICIFSIMNFQLLRTA